jgi:hypothetical protein
MLDLPVVEEDHGQDDSTSSSVTTLRITGGINGSRLPVGGVCRRPDGEAHAHTGSRGEEKSPSTGPVNDEGTLSR